MGSHAKANGRNKRRRIRGEGEKREGESATRQYDTRECRKWCVRRRKTKLIPRERACTFLIARVEFTASSLYRFASPCGFVIRRLKTQTAMTVDVVSTFRVTDRVTHVTSILVGDLAIA